MMAKVTDINIENDVHPRITGDVRLVAEENLRRLAVENAENQLLDELTDEEMIVRGIEMLRLMLTIGYGNDPHVDEETTRIHTLAEEALRRNAHITEEKEYYEGLFAVLNLENISLAECYLSEEGLIELAIIVSGRDLQEDKRVKIPIECIAYNPEATDLSSDDHLEPLTDEEFSTCVTIALSMENLTQEAGEVQEKIARLLEQASREESN